MPDHSLQRRSYFDNQKPDMVLVHYLKPPANTRAVQGVKGSTSSAVAAAAAATVVVRPPSAPTAEVASSTVLAPMQNVVAAATDRVPLVSQPPVVSMPPVSHQPSISQPPVVLQLPSSQPSAVVPVIVSAPEAMDVDSAKQPLLSNQPEEKAVAGVSTLEAQKQPVEVKEAPAPTPTGLSKEPAKPAAVVRLLAENAGMEQLGTPPSPLDSKKLVSREDSGEDMHIDAAQATAAQPEHQKDEAGKEVPSEVEHQHIQQRCDVEMPDAAANHPPAEPAATADTIDKSVVVPADQLVTDTHASLKKAEEIADEDVAMVDKKSEQEPLMPKENTATGWRLFSWLRGPSNKVQSKDIRALVAIGVRLRLPFAAPKEVAEAVNIICGSAKVNLPSLASILDCSEPLNAKSLQHATSQLMGVSWYRVKSGIKEGDVKLEIKEEQSALDFDKKWDSLVNQLPLETRTLILDLVNGVKESMRDDAMEELASAETDNRTAMSKALGSLFNAGVLGTSVRDLGAYILINTTPIEWAANYFEYIRDAVLANEVDKAGSLVKQALDNRPDNIDQGVKKEEK